MAPDDAETTDLHLPDLASPAPPPPPPPSPPAPVDPGWAPTQILPRRRAPGSGNALPLGLKLGEFEILRVLGEGGFGIVYLVQDHMLQRQVAIKEYFPATLSARDDDLSVRVTSESNRGLFQAGLDGFLNEARMLAQFDHASLVKVYRFWRERGTAYMVMPYYEGTTLKAALKALGSPPDERWLMALLAPLTEALAVLHAERCYHRDIAPDNILLLAGSGRPLLLDFGAARQVISDATQALTAILKPGYAPVEQYAEVPGLKQGPWTDLYALSAVVYAAITGHKPPAAVGRSVADSYVPLVQQAAGRYSAGFLQAIDRGLQVRPEDRPASVAEFRQSLAIDGGGVGGVTIIVPSTKPSPAAPAPAPALPPVAMPPVAVAASRPGRLPWIAAGGAGLLLAAAALWWGLASRPATAPAQSAAPLQQPSQAPAQQLPPTTAATSAEPWTPVAEFDRMLQAATSGFEVQAGATQPTLRIGRDRLQFTVRSSRDGFLYVLVSSTDGSLMLLYPNTQSGSNRVRAGQVLTLPQANWPLDTFEPEGDEHFIALVSEQPRDFAALKPEREAWFQRLPTGDAGAALARTHAGSGSAFAGRAACQEPGCDRFGAARFSVRVTR